MECKGAEIIIKTLIDEGLDTVFGYPGGAVLDIYNALYDYRDKIRHVRPSHEQGGAHAADGYSRSTGKTGVVIATSGPGATNLITGIATANIDSIPMVCITGNVAGHLLGKDAFQEIDVYSATMAVTKHNFMVRDVTMLQDTIRRAFMIANSGRKGPVLIDIPKDVMQKYAEFEHKAPLEYNRKVSVNPDEIACAAELIDKAKKPVIFAGGGIVSANASEELRRLMNKTSVPAVNTIMAMGCLGKQDHLNLGMVGMHGKNSSNYAVEHSDLLIALGTRFSDRVALNTKHFAPNAKVLHVDIDGSEISKNIMADYSIVADVKVVIEGLFQSVAENKREAWLREIDDFRANDYEPDDSESDIRPHQLLRYISDQLNDDDFIVTDVGQHQMWAAQYNGRVKPRTFITPGGLGTMGFGFGAAIGAKVGNPDRRVIHISGDGSFAMNMNELRTAVDHGINTITVIINNHTLGMVRQWQNLLYDKRFSYTDIERGTDYVKYAESMHAKGYSCKTPAEFRQAFAEALTHAGPVIIEAVVDKDTMVYPMIPAGGTVRDIIHD